MNYTKYLFKCPCLGYDAFTASSSSLNVVLYVRGLLLILQRLWVCVSSSKCQQENFKLMKRRSCCTFFERLLASFGLPLLLLSLVFIIFFDLGSKPID